MNKLTYEDCKELKEAGFPFRFVIGDEEYFKTGPINIPDLSELIYECGFKGFVFWELEGIFYAGKDDKIFRSDIYYDGYPRNLNEGTTLEQAVKNLYLELNNK